MVHARIPISIVVCKGRWWDRLLYIVMPINTWWPSQLDKKIKRSKAMNKKRILIYEYVPNGTLHHHLHGNVSFPWFFSLKMIMEFMFSLYFIWFSWSYIYVCIITASGMPVLNWDKRLKIAIGAAKGLAYLHEDCEHICIYFLLL